MAAAAADLFRTRNGKQKACEPCRRRKTACDHSLPICTQCIRRKAPQYCVYMFPRTAAFQSNNPNLTSIGGSAQDGVHTDGPSPLSITAGPTLKSVNQFFGDTSFLATLSEGLHVHALYQAPETPISVDSSHFQIDPNFNITPGLFPLASKVLMQLLDDTTCLLLFDRYNNHNDEIIRPAINQVLKLFCSSFGDELRQGKASSIRKIANLISQNTSIPIEDDQDGLEKWMKSSSPQMIRWEGIGIILSHMCFGLISSGGEDSFLVKQEGSEKDREITLKEMRESVASCIKLSQEYSGNTLLAYLIYKHSVLEGIVNGDTSPTVWILHGELIGTVTSLGMHREDTRSKARTDLSIEVRRRVFSSIFIMDKILATFTGRPPLISHRFTSTLPPLDISDEALLAGNHSIATAIALMKNGWGTNGIFNPSAMLRARRLLGAVRSEILDEALGESSLYDSYQALLQLRKRCKDIYSTFPSVLIHRLEDYASSEKPMSENFARYNLRLEYLHSLFLLEQLISKHEQSPAQGLFDTSREMLSLVLLFWNQRERFLGVSMGASWMILNFAVPASDTLCVELLRQSRASSQTPCAWIPHSETIQNLSMLVTFLDWVPPSAPNASICQRLQKRISGILGELLSHPPTSEHAILLEQSTMPSDIYDYEALTEFIGFDCLGDLNTVDLFNWIP